MGYNVKNGSKLCDIKLHENKAEKGEKKKEINFISFKSLSLNFLDFGVKITFIKTATIILF